MERGKGHSGPVIVDDKLVFIHQVDQNEEVCCLDSATGKTIWDYSYAVDVAQNSGNTDTPRSSPVIDPETKLVYTLGNDGDLICFELVTGEVKWKLELESEFGPSPFFLATVPAR